MKVHQMLPDIDVRVGCDIMTSGLITLNSTLITSTDEIHFRSKLLPWEDFIIGTYLLIVCILAVGLNVLVMYTCFYNWDRLNNQDSYILNLACSDVILPLSGFPLSISSSYQHQWMYGHSGCVLYGFIGFYFGLVSITTLTIMGLTRYIKICHPHIDISGRSFSRATVVFPYIYALIWSTIPLGGVGSYSLESYGTSCTLQWDDNRLYITFMSVFCIVSPAFLITFTYGLILLKCRRSSLNLRVWRSPTNKMSPKDSYLIKITFAMCWAFLISWMPYAVVSMWTAYGDKKIVPIRLTVVAVLMAKSSIVVNPVIYFLFSKKFRPMLLKTLRFKARNHADVLGPQGNNDSNVNHWSRDNQDSDKKQDSFNSLSRSDLIGEVNIKVHIYQACVNEAEL